MLSRAQADEVWRLFQNSPLFVRWHGVQAQIPLMLDPLEVAPGRAIYRQGEAPGCLYLVGAGTVHQTITHDGQAWLQQEFRPGQFFGQQALFTNEYLAQASSNEGATLYCLGPAQLRTAMEWNADLYETLLREKLAGRLRRIPMFRQFADAEIGWLAQVVEESDLAQGASLSLASGPGIWFVDAGQMGVTGPANPHPERWSTWGITAGNFFAALGPGMHLGANCAADTATAAVKTHLLYLPAKHANRIMVNVPDVQEVLAHPPDIAAELATRAPFNTLSEQQREHLAQFCGWWFIPDGQNITTQGSIGHSYVILRGGAAIVSAQDDRGRMRPRNALAAGSAYGTTSLLEGKPREATVRAVKAASLDGRPPLPGAEVIALDRRDMQYAFEALKPMWQAGTPLVRQAAQVKEKRQPYEWMEEGEVLRWQGRPHILWLIVPECGVLFGFLLLAALVAFSPPAARQAWLVFSIIAGGLGLTLIGIFVWSNYLDDYYVVTNRRVTRRDRVALLYERRVQAPVDMIQDVTVDSGLLGRLLDFGHVTIRTAAKVGATTFSHVPQPDLVRGIILQEKTGAVAAIRSQQKEALRSGLISGLGLAMPVAERTRALGPTPQLTGPTSRWRRFLAPDVDRAAPPRLLPGTRRGEPAWVTNLRNQVPENWRQVLFGDPAPPTKPLPGQYVWRKHWIVLVRRAVLPFLVLALLLAVAAGTSSAGVDFLGAGREALCVPWGFLLAATIGWLAYQVADYRNDLYVVTDDKIIDIEQRPLGLSAKRREGSLDRIQSVNSTQVGFFAAVLNYGDVIIRTAAADEGYDFLTVPNPKQVQTIIFQKLDTYRRAQEAQKARERQRELIEGLEVYHQLRESGLGQKLRSGPTGGGTAG